MRDSVARNVFILGWKRRLIRFGHQRRYWNSEAKSLPEASVNENFLEGSMRRIDIRAILKDPKLQSELIRLVVEFLRRIKS